MLAALVVLTTLAVLATGVARGGWAELARPLVLVQKVSLIAWAVFVGLHSGHVRELARLPAPTRTVAGGGGRWISLTGAVVAGAVLAISLIPQFSAWTR